ncbi:MAG: pyridoxal phosphate-dependent aminotransferase family protein [Chitinophagales bacterium]
MESNANRQLETLLQKRKDKLLFRSLKDSSGLIDFCSNDYLGFSTLGILKNALGKQEDINSESKFYGATGSRLISGNSREHEALEVYLAEFYQREAALLFNSGYDANLGLYSALPQKNDLVLFDELCHASIRDGLKMCRGKSLSFPHNDLEALETHLQYNSDKYAQIYVATESVFSMDGDFAPLKELVKLKEKYAFELLLDEAHATGIFGKNGEGRAVELNLHNEIFASVHTFGKALGAHGAVVLGGQILKQFLINFSRPFIFTTALPLSSVKAIKTAHDILSNEDCKLNEISTLRNLLKVEIEAIPNAELILSESQIQSLLIPGNERAKAVASALEETGIYAKAILYPTVPKGKERIRICLHEFNTIAEINLLCKTLKEALK